MLLHLLSPVIAIPAFVVWRLLDRPARAPRSQRSFAAVAAWSSFVAGMVHVVVAPDHWEESLLYGVFFLAVSLGQLGFAILVAWRPTARLLVVGAIGQLAIVALWAVTRTVGIPLGPEAGTVEAIGAMDLISVAVELVCALACVAAAGATRNSDGVSAAVNRGRQSRGDHPPHLRGASRG
jgi:hypothetical protein